MAELSSQSNQKNTKHIPTTLLGRFVFFALVVILVPLLPSKAPGCISEGILTRGWELIHVILVGIAVSYGLFCRKNVEYCPIVEKDEVQLKVSDMSESYVSQILQVETVFDEESSGMSVKNTAESVVAIGESETQLWNSRCCGEKPAVFFESKEFVLPSPIPWRSRSSKLMEVKNEDSIVIDTDCFSSSSLITSSDTSVEKKQSFRSPTPEAAESKNCTKKRTGFSRKFIIESTSDDEDSDSDPTSSLTDSNEEHDEDVEEEDIDSNEVDMKADEFIAKFREQMRVQKMETLKTSTVNNLQTQKING
ncbi:hypothetical protein ZOSMA_203G00200 [Zostera marina]|uniref:Uncharacterized protein n=1 Tax=Zostera marina TaxID=29655 RepID=A0A0K9PLG0_ZOSMR|nr:hypothetical protein ZOSMA_203G00200 [Zostera marina]